MAMAIIPSTSSVSSEVSWRKIPLSSTSRVRNGLTIPSSAEMTISPSTEPRRTR